MTLDRAVQMIQRRVLPDGGHVDETLDYADAKVVAQGEYVAGGYSTLDYILAMTGEFINRIPDVDVALGGEFRWRLPWAVRPGYRGYFTFPGGVYYADHPRTMTALGGIETFLDPADSKAYCWAYLRVDMWPMMKHDSSIGEEKGVLNRRRPWDKWTPGSWIKFSVRYQTE